MLDLTQLLPVELKLDILGLLDQDTLLHCSLLSHDWRNAARLDNRFLYTCCATVELNQHSAYLKMQRMYEIIQAARLTRTRLRFRFHAREAPPGSLGIAASTAFDARLQNLCEVLFDSMAHIAVLDLQFSASLAMPVFAALRTSAPNLQELRIKNLGLYCPPARDGLHRVKKSLDLPWALFSGSAPMLRLVALSSIAIAKNPQPAFTRVRTAYICYATSRDAVHENLSPTFPVLSHLKTTLVQATALMNPDVRQHVNLRGFQNIRYLDLDCSNSSIESDYELSPSLLSAAPHIRFRNVLQHRPPGSFEPITHLLHAMPSNTQESVHFTAASTTYFCPVTSQVSNTGSSDFAMNLRVVNIDANQAVNFQREFARLRSTIGTQPVLIRELFLPLADRLTRLEIDAALIHALVADSPVQRPRLPRLALLRLFLRHYWYHWEWPNGFRYTTREGHQVDCPALEELHFNAVRVKMNIDAEVLLHIAHAFHGQGCSRPRFITHGVTLGATPNSIEKMATVFRSYEKLDDVLPLEPIAEMIPESFSWPHAK